MSLPRKTAITAALMHATQSMSTDIYIVAMPLIGLEFNASLVAVQATMIAFVLGLPLSHLFVGRFADYFGRKPVAITGLCLYLCATMAGFFAPSLEALVLARFLQGMATASLPILMRAIVRDSVTPQETPQTFSKMGVMAAFGPILAPTLGSIALYFGGWRACFLVLIVYSSIVMFCVVFLLKETLRDENRVSSPFSNPFSALSIVIKERDFRIGALLIYCGYGGLYAWLSTSSYILNATLGFSVQQTGVALGLCAGFFFLGSVIANRYLKIYGMKNMAIFAGIVGAIGSILCAVVLYMQPPLYVMILCVIPYYVAWGVVQPLAMGIAMRPFSTMAGQASAWFGIMQFLGAASVAFAAGILGGGVATFMMMALTMIVVFCVGLRFNAP